MPKMLVMELSGLNPDWVEKWLEEMPNIKEMQQQGIWGHMQSTVPPGFPQSHICAQSGRNPGVYGFWGEVNRKSFSYQDTEKATAQQKAKRVKSLYDLLPMSGKKVAIVGLPLTSPPPRIPGGYVVAPCLSEDDKAGMTWPRSLGNEVESKVGELLPELDSDKAARFENPEILNHIRAVDEQRFELVRYFMAEKQCDVVFGSVRGSEALSRIFCRFADEKYKNFEADTAHANVLEEYYQWVDDQIGETLRVLDDDTALLVYSDYPIQRRDGIFRMNEWLIQEGYLSLHEYPSEPVPFSDLNVDWNKTRAWVSGRSGGTTINLQGRETNGVVEKEVYEGLLDELISKIKDIPDESGGALETKVYKRYEIYSGPFADIAPDLFVFLDDCRWEVDDRVGFGAGNLYSQDSTHFESHGTEGFYGYFALSGPAVPSEGEHQGASLIDIAPTVLDVLDLEIPEELEGISFSGKERTPEEEEALIQERLKFLGY